MANIAFPKKVLLGNFDNELISTRSTGFESLLKHISLESKLRSSNSLLRFLQEVELMKAKDLLEKKDHVVAYPILENNFKLLNKVSNNSYALNLLFLIINNKIMISMKHSEMFTHHKQFFHNIVIHVYLTGIYR